MPMGQGIKSALGQICAEQFGVSTADVAVTAGDTAVIPHGQGGFASRQTVTAGSAVHLAARAVRGKAVNGAAHLLEANPADPQVRDGRIEIPRAPGSALSLREIPHADARAPRTPLPPHSTPTPPT